MITKTKSADDIDFHRKLLIQVEGKAFPLEMHLVHYKVIVKHVAAVAVDNSTVRVPFAYSSKTPLLSNKKMQRNREKRMKERREEVTGIFHAWPLFPVSPGGIYL